MLQYYLSLIIEAAKIFEGDDDEGQNSCHGRGHSFEIPLNMLFRRVDGLNVAF